MLTICACAPEAAPPAHEANPNPTAHVEADDATATATATARLFGEAASARDADTLTPQEPAIVHGVVEDAERAAHRAAAYEHHTREPEGRRAPLETGDALFVTVSPVSCGHILRSKKPAMMARGADSSSDDGQRG
jgi:hypothetical protein